MVLGVCLIKDIESERVAQLIPARLGWRVGCTHGIDVSLFHEAYVLQHAFFRNDACVVRVKLYAVDTTETHLLAVDEKHAVLYGKMAETNFLHCLFDGFSLVIDERQAQCIQIWCLCSPCLHIGHNSVHAVELHMSALRIPLIHHTSLMCEIEYRQSVSRHLCHLCAFSIIECCHNFVPFTAVSVVALQLRIYLQGECAICVIYRNGADSIVAQTY